MSAVTIHVTDPRGDDFRPPSRHAARECRPHRRLPASSYSTYSTSRSTQLSSSSMLYGNGVGGVRVLPPVRFRRTDVADQRSLAILTDEVTTIAAIRMRKCDV